MIVSFFDSETEDLFNGVRSRRAHRRCPPIIWPVVRRKLTQVNRIRDPEDLQIPLRNRLNPGQVCRQDRQGVRISERFVVRFRWVDGHAEQVEIVDAYQEAREARERSEGGES
jgi:toxin HigB-1